MNYDKEAKRVYNIMFNWREELKGNLHWFDSHSGFDQANKFIESEIIEKLIDDIPDNLLVRGGDGVVNVLTNAKILKQHLRAKWLDKDNI